MKVVFTTGHFNPLHSKHIEYLNAAKALGDYLVVIVNNDFQVFLKGANIVFNEKERLDIVSNLKCVDEAVLCIDEDAATLETLKMLYNKYKGHELIFAKSGDRNVNNTTEYPFLREYGFACYWDIIEYDPLISSSILRQEMNL